MVSGLNLVRKKITFSLYMINLEALEASIAYDNP